MKKATPVKEKTQKSRSVSQKPLRVLIIEDNEDDTLLVVRELKNGGYTPQVKRVETAASMKKALQNEQWDIILCDYSLPKFNAEQAINLLREITTEIPLIIVSGAIGEETAADCMILGARDFIRKNNLSRLCPAVTRELVEAKIRKEQKQIEGELKESENKFRNIFEQSKDGIIFFDEKTQKIILGNAAMADMLGCSQKDLIGKSISSLHPPNNWPEVKREFLKHVKGEASLSPEIPVIRNDGFVLYADISSSPIIIAKEKFFCAIFHDITEHKQAQEALRESEEKYRNILASIQEGYFEVDIGGTYTFVNEVNCRLLGYTKEEMIGMNYRQHMDKAAVKKIQKPYTDLYWNDKPIESLEVESYKKDGTKIICETSVSLLRDAQGKKIGYRGVSRNITARKQAEEALRESEEKYRLTFASTSDIIFTLDAKLQITNITPSVKKILGLDEEYLIGKHIADLTVSTPESVNRGVKNIKQILSGKYVPPTVYESIGKDKNIHFIEVTAAPIIRGNKIIGVTCVARDITDRITTENHLKESEENFRRSLDESPLGIRIVSAKGETLYANKAILNIYGYDSVEELNATPVQKRYTSESYAEYRTRKALRDQGKKYPSEYEISIIRKDGEIRHLDVFRKEIIWNRAKQYQVIYHDITKQKLAEAKTITALAALKDREEKYRAILETMEEGYYEVDLKGDFTFFNDALARIHGRTRKEMMGMNNRAYNTPETSKRIFKIFNEMYRHEGSPTQIIDYEIIRKDGSIVFAEFSASLLKDSSGKTIGFHGIVRDRTDQRKAEKALEESEQKYRTILETMDEGYYEVDLAGNTIFVNDAMCQIHGCSREEVIGKNNRDYTDPETANNIYKAFNEVYLTGKTGKTAEHQIIRKDGSKIWVDASISLRRDSSGNKIGFKGIVRDISERKKAEESLRESEEKFRTIIENMEEGFYEADLTGTITYANDAMCRIHGYSREELIGLNYRRFTSPETADDVYKEYNNVYRSGIPAKGYGHKIIRKDGKTRILDLSFSLIRDSSGRKTGFRGTVRDITERVKTETALQESELLLRKSQEVARLGSYNLDVIKGTWVSSPILDDIFGINESYPKDVNGWIDLIHPDEKDEMFNYLNQHVLGQHNKFNKDYRIIRKSDGQERWVSGLGELTFDKDGRVTNMIGTFQDIAERKNAEKELNERDIRFRKLSFHVPGMIYQFQRKPDGTYCLPFTTEAINDLFGCSSEDVLKDISPITNVVLPDDLGPFMDSIETSAQNMTNWECEFRVQIPGQPVKWMLGNSTPEKQPDGSIIWYGFVNDITERKLAQETIIESEKKLKEAQAYAHIGNWELDTNMQGAYWSEEMFRMLEFDPASGVPPFETYLQKIHPDDRERVGTNVPKGVSEKKPYYDEYRVILCDGSVRWIVSQGKPIFDENGNMIKYSGIAQDITERKAAQEELQKKHEELETMIEASPIMIYFKDLNNRYTRVNKAVFEVSGLPKEDMEGRSNEEINPRHAAKFMQEDKKIIATGKPIIGTFETIKTKKGEKVLQTDKVPYRDKNGNIIGIIGFSVDITERKKAQDDLAASELKYRSLVENAQEGIYQTTPEGKFITVNNGFAKIYGYNSAQEVLQSITDISRQLYVNPHERERLLKLVQKYGAVNDFETQGYRKDGGRIWTSLNAHAVLDDQKRVLYFQGTVRDISEKKQIEAERLENVKRLRKALGATINAMAVTVETRDPYTAGHQRRVADLARAIATEMKLTADQIDGVRMAGMIHDIGKISIPSEILTKPTQLTALEYNLIKTHPDSGHAILKDIEFPWPIARIVLEHHERVDGSGYPFGLKGNEILLESKILAVADVVEAISSHRPYRAAHGIEAGLEEIEKNKGVLYDAEAVEICLRLFREKSYNLAA